MITCEFCGNPVAENLSQCPYCAHPLAPTKPNKNRNEKTLLILNLEAGKPFVKEALARFDKELKFINNQNVGLLKIIHGYGSTGKGGKIKIALQQHLKALLKNQQISKIILGENYSKSSQSAKSYLKLIEAYPELSETIQADKYNPGITFVEL